MQVGWIANGICELLTKRELALMCVTSRWRCNPQELLQIAQCALVCTLADCSCGGLQWMLAHKLCYDVLAATVTSKTSKLWSREA